MSAPPTTAEAVRVLREALLSFGCPTSGECQGVCPRCAALAATENVREDANAELLAACRAAHGECRNQLVRGQLEGLSDEGPSAVLWAGLRDRLAAAIVRAEAAHAPDAWDAAPQIDRDTVLIGLRGARQEAERAYLEGMPMVRDGRERRLLAFDAVFARLGARP